MAAIRAPVLPQGTVTFVLADVQGSVRLWESTPTEMAAGIVKFNTLVSELVGRHGGARPAEQGEGDSFVAVFPVAADAVAFALALQQRLHSEAWAVSLPLLVRIAVHTGTGQLRDGDNYMGPTVNRCARMRSLAHGGQVLLSGATSALVADELGEGATLIDLGTHPLRDFDRPEHLFQLADSTLPREFPALRDDATARGGGLPRAPTTFVAREAEMARVDGMFDTDRLVTLMGAGGSGKTRLALEWARRQVDRFADGVAWADAAPIGDGALVVSCVASALGVREVASEPLLDTVVKEVGDGEYLLVLDNCEHVIDDAARVIERLLGECPGLSILTTSREPIGLSGEASMRVPSLDERAASRLFVDRARSVSSEFDLTTGCADAVAEVCRRLDGIPLAIELAAARVRVLTPQQIADGLADRFSLLTGGSRTALPRQRTLEASVDWSYRLLSDSERHLLDRLSVFAGGFTLDAAQHVCSGEPVPEAAVLDVLTALVDKSLVQVDRVEARDETRYRMLETIRHFARQRLADADGGEAVRDRHLEYFLAMAEEIAPRIEGGDEVVWLDRLDADIDNLRAALDWAQHRGDTHRLLRLAAALWLFWEVRCRFEEGCTWMHRALEADAEPTATRATALYGLGDMSLFTLELETVVSAGEEVLRIGAVLDDPAVNIRGTTLLGWAAAFGAYRDTAWARGALTTMLAELPEDTSRWLVCDAMTALGLVCINLGDLREASRANEQALESAEQVRSVGAIQRACYFVGMTRVLQGEVEAGQQLLQRAIGLAGELYDTFFSNVSLATLALAKYVQGDIDGAHDDASQAWAMAQRHGNPTELGLAGLSLALAEAARGDDESALATLATITPIAEQLAQTWHGARVHGARAFVDARRGDLDAARSRLAVPTETGGGGPYARGQLALYRGWVERLAGNDNDAEAAFVEALQAAGDAGARGDVSLALDELGGSASRRGKHDRAARLFGAADGVRARLHLPLREVIGLPSRRLDLATTRAALGEEAFATELAAGAAMSEVGALRFALRGKGGRRRPTSGWESLTPTELEVVRLVADGLSNPEIAERLLVARGTVKAHLSHVFTKLGVRTRSELAAEVARRHLDT